MTDNNKEIKLQSLFDQMDEILANMENKEISLEDMFDMYHKGMDLLKECTEKIGHIEKKMLALDEEGGMYEFES